MKRKKDVIKKAVLASVLAMSLNKMVCWICLYFSPPFQSTRTARYSSHRRSGCHRPATPQCSLRCIRGRRCRCRSGGSVCIFRRSSFVLLSSTGFLFLYILIIALLVVKVKFFPKKFFQKGTWSRKTARVVSPRRFTFSPVKHLAQQAIVHLTQLLSLIHIWRCRRS